MKTQQLVGAAIGAALGFIFFGGEKADKKPEKTEDDENKVIDDKQ